jgi:uncharacterized protein
MLFKSFILLLVIVNIFCIYIFVIEPHNLEIKNIRYPLSDTDASLHGLRIIHISDLHIGSIGFYEKKVIKAVNEHTADFICITGDLIMYNQDFQHAIDFINRLRAKDSVYIVFGNSDYSYMHSFISAIKERPLTANIHIIRNQLADASFKNTPVLFAGLDDPITAKADYEAFPYFTKLDRFTILLSHAYTKKVAEITLGVDLVLAGHTHGGQVNILPSHYIKQWRNQSALNESVFIDGFHRHEGTWINISRGVGMSYLPIRFRSRPDICVLDFIYSGVSQP